MVKKIVASRPVLGKNVDEKGKVGALTLVAHQVHRGGFRSATSPPGEVAAAQC